VRGCLCFQSVEITVIDVGPFVRSEDRFVRCFRYGWLFRSRLPQRNQGDQTQTDQDLLQPLHHDFLTSTPRAIRLRYGISVTSFSNFGYSDIDPSAWLPCGGDDIEFAIVF
jgi:hypothetical protein